MGKTQDKKKQQQKADKTSQQEVEEQEETVQESSQEESSEADKVKELEDKYLRLYSEFENYRRRTAKERLELSGSANEELIKELLPVLDDFERALGAMDAADNVGAVKEGVQLIFDKFYKALNRKGLEPVEAIGKELDTELHEAITQAPAPKEALKGKIIDVVEKGYTLNGKVIRFAKAIIGN